MRRYNLLAGFVALCLLLTISGSAWNQSAKGQKATVSDTVPDKKERKIKDLDEAIEELDKAQIELELQLSKQDWSKIEKEIKDAMEKIDMTKVKIEMDKALKEADFEKMKVDLANSLKDLDTEKMKAEIQASIAKIDMDKIKADMEKVKVDIDIDMKKMEEQLSKIRPEIEKSMEEAKKSMEKAKAEMKEFKEFVDGLEKDGLIKKDAPYKIEHENGVLKINGKTQPESVYNKYRSFLEKRKDFTIKKDEDDFNIDLD